MPALSMRIRHTVDLALIEICCQLSPYDTCTSMYSCQTHTPIHVNTYAAYTLLHILKYVHVQLFAPNATVRAQTQRL